MRRRVISAGEREQSERISTTAARRGAGVCGGSSLSRPSDLRHHLHPFRVIPERPRRTISIRVSTSGTWSGVEPSNVIHQSLRLDTDRPVVGRRRLASVPRRRASARPTGQPGGTLYVRRGGRKKRVRNAAAGPTTSRPTGAGDLARRAVARRRRLRRGRGLVGGEEGPTSQFVSVPTRTAPAPLAPRLAPHRRPAPAARFPRVTGPRGRARV